MGEFDEAEDGQGGDGATHLELNPGAERKAELFGQERPAILSEHLLADLTDAEGQVPAAFFAHGCPYLATGRSVMCRCADVTVLPIGSLALGNGASNSSRRCVGMSVGENPCPLSNS